MHRDLEAALRLALDATRAARDRVRFDQHSRTQYATDGSLYAIDPIGVVLPRNTDDIVAVMETARRFGVSVLPRGAGTSLAGQTVGRSIVVDISRDMHRIIGIDPEARVARVEPGVVQDDLNRAAAAHGLLFAPDTSTANRATLGGMIGNNSCGARSARYGMTIDHVAELDVVLSDASRATFSAVDEERRRQLAHGASLEAALYRDVHALIDRHAVAIRRDVPPYWRRAGGYRLERLLPESGPFSLANLITGSEGTLGFVTEATVRLVPVPRSQIAVAGHFHSVASAIDGADDARQQGAAAIELVERFILDLARTSPVHGALVQLLEGAPGAVLFVEFHGDSDAEVTAAVERLERSWARPGKAYATRRATTAIERKRFQDLRRAGNGMLQAAARGAERSLAFIEDTAVPPEVLGAYTERLAAVLQRHGLRAGFYGHASAGCLHVRPFLDLTRPGAIDTLRAVAEEVLALVTEYGGMNSSEHGDGLVRSEFNERIFGTDVYGAMCEVKRIFDPEGRLNPGKKVHAPPMTDSLREPALPRPRSLPTHFAFGDDGMHGHVNRCARIGACRKSPGGGGTMCPSFMATRDERHSTRGRAMSLLAALGSTNPADAMARDDLHEVLDLCLECKACRSECPMSVDMAMLKSEQLAQRYAKEGAPLRARMFAHARDMNRVASSVAPLANALLQSRPVRFLLEKVTGVDRRRPLPVYASESLPQWFTRRPHDTSAGTRRVMLLADSFTSYTEPEVGRAAVELLEAAGWRVELIDDVCCGRALISKGFLPAAQRTQQRLLDRMAEAAGNEIPIVSVEPSCLYTLVDELPSLCHGDPRATVVARQSRLVEELMVEAATEGRVAFAPLDREVLLHPHCHQKAAHAGELSARLLRAIPGARVTVLDAGCCGLAGSFGHETEHHDLSLTIGGLRLFPAVEAAPTAIIAATGTSCRHQIAYGTARTAVHPLVLMRRQLIH